MMISIKSTREIELMRQAGRITALARSEARKHIQPGVTTGEIDRAVNRFILAQGATPTFLHYDGFPKSTCISVNDELIHGIPGSRVLREGDIVSVDVGATYKGYVGDCAGTYAVGSISPEAQKLIDVTRQSFFEGLQMARAGHRLWDISGAVQRYVESFGYSVVREYVGHGVGSKMHEDPEVPNFVPERDRAGRNPRLVAGMTLAVEPMVNAGAPEVGRLANGWTVVTSDHSLCAHYENTILITGAEAEILTLADDI